MRALTAAEVAAEFGRSEAWLMLHWRQLVAEKTLPPPLRSDRGLAWSAAQVYAFIDRQLPPSMRAAAAAYRAAFDAARAAPLSPVDPEEIERWRAALHEKFGSEA